jgi:hypothetical protein
MEAFPSLFLSLLYGGGTMTTDRYGLVNDISFNIFERGQGKIRGEPREQGVYPRVMESKARQREALHCVKTKQMKQKITQDFPCNAENTIYDFWSYCKKMMFNSHES